MAGAGGWSVGDEVKHSRWADRRRKLWRALGRIYRNYRGSPEQRYACPGCARKLDPSRLVSIDGFPLLRCYHPATCDTCGKFRDAYIYQEKKEENPCSPITENPN